MNSSCPRCKTEMQEGFVSVEGTFWGFVFFGLSHQHLWFRPGSGAPRERIVECSQGKSAFRCSKCGTTVIPGD